MSGRDELRERIARALWDRSHLGREPIWAWEYAPPPSRESQLDYADAVIAALGLVEWTSVGLGGQEFQHYAITWERIEDDA